MTHGWCDPVQGKVAFEDRAFNYCKVLSDRGGRVAQEGPRGRHRPPQLD